MRNVWASADLHYKHSNILKYCKRTFALNDWEKEQLEKGIDFRVSRESTKIHDEHLLDQTNSYVKKDDILIIVGDFCYGSKRYRYETAKYYRDRIDCKNVILVWGNHDGLPWKTQEDLLFPKNRIPEIAPLFSSTHDILHVNLFNIPFIFCHYCMVVYNKSHRKAIHCYGHSHSGLEPTMNEKFKQRRSIDVGVDNAYKVLGEYRPFNLFDDVIPMMKDKEGEKVDHHDPWLGKDPNKSEEEVMEELYPEIENEMPQSI